MKIHQIKIDFQVTEQVNRYVFVYVIDANHCYLIDSGVYGSEKQILEYLTSIGRKASDIKGIFLTHAHPDHIGTAAWFRENFDCPIYASAGEKKWIEDIDVQYEKRPIPNFYKIAGKSSKVDVVVKDGEVITLEDDLQVEVVSTPGHSADEMSYIVGDAVFIGDAVPVKGDIPIFVSVSDTVNSLKKISDLEGINNYYPAWDQSYSSIMMQNMIEDAYEIIDKLDQAVKEAGQDLELSELVDLVCNCLGMPMFKSNPLFSNTIESFRQR